MALRHLYSRRRTQRALLPLCKLEQPHLCSVPVSRLHRIRSPPRSSPSARAFRSLTPVPLQKQFERHMMKFYYNTISLSLTYHEQHSCPQSPPPFRFRQNATSIQQNAKRPQDRQDKLWSEEPSY